ncbi:MAG TPA: SpoIID/LytB domain-containing protein [Patescibacteria group bacterium]|nr:SpoIID/LytB domain-containing protein [Patescibacteria group bacterium]
MRKFLPILFTLTFIFASLFFLVVPNKADELDDLTKQINDLTSALNQSVNATRPLESQLSAMQAQITGIKNRVVQIEEDVTTKQQQIDDGYKDLNAKKDLLNKAIRNYYIKQSYNSPVLIFFSGQTASEITQILQYQKVAADSDKQIITNIALTIQNLQDQQKTLEDEKTRLTALKATLDEQSAKLDTIVSGAHAYQASLSSQISQLSAKQQSLLAAKLGSLNIPLFAIAGGGCSSDVSPYKSPGFGGPEFGLFSYGVPNRVGLNQYGAWGRAKARQDQDAILHAYYNFDGYQNMSATIRVNDSNGYDSGNVIWSGSLDDYVRRIYEVPDSWTDNGNAALKAQAIAARSYVMAETNNGAKSICATQNCQVFKTDPKGGNWDQAVSATAGQVMVQGGSPITAYFSSTHGGYMFTTSDIGWAATSFTKRGQDSSSAITSWSSLNSNAYDKDSPWFYCDWGGRSQYNNTAWMTSSEIADIVNSILLVQNEPSADAHILQPDVADPQMWTPDQVKSELSKYRTPFSSISGGSVDADFGSGKSTTVHLSGDQGSFDVDAVTFRKYFNLRAPAKIQIVGYLYNLEIH